MYELTRRGTLLLSLDCRTEPPRCTLIQVKPVARLNKIPQCGEQKILASMLGLAQPGQQAPRN